MQDRHLIPARKGAAARIKEGQILRVTNTHGSQVVDFWELFVPVVRVCL